jgi:hypothetical protein
MKENTLETTSVAAHASAQCCNVFKTCRYMPVEINIRYLIHSVALQSLDSCGSWYHCLVGRNSMTLSISEKRHWSALHGDRTSPDLPYCKVSADVPAHS